MRYAVFSDIHGNLEAFEAVMVFFKKENLDHFIFCGDLVGYGPNPSECTEIAMQMIYNGPENNLFIKGNHDAMISGDPCMRKEWFNSNAQIAIEFAKSKLSQKHINFLKNMPERIDHDEFTIVHGSPKDPLKEYMLSDHQFNESDDCWHVSPCFIGHTHLPCSLVATVSRPAVIEPLKQHSVLEIHPGEKVMINPGAVGQPRDGDWRASCGVYDSAKRTFVLHKIQYDFKTTQEKMRKENMPAPLIARLAQGL